MLLPEDGAAAAADEQPAEGAFASKIEASKVAEARAAAARTQAAEAEAEARAEAEAAEQAEREAEAEASRARVEREAAERAEASFFDEVKDILPFKGLLKGK